RPPLHILAAEREHRPPRPRKPKGEGIGFVQDHDLARQDPMRLPAHLDFIGVVMDGEDVVAAAIPERKPVTRHSCSAIIGLAENSPISQRLGPDMEIEIQPVAWRESQGADLRADELVQISEPALRRNILGGKRKHDRNRSLSEGSAVNSGMTYRQANAISM